MGKNELCKRMKDCEKIEACGKGIGSIEDCRKD